MKRWTITTAAAAALAIGVAVGWTFKSAAPPTPVYASTAMGADNFAVATGLVDEGIEAFYFLDFLTGTLKATVINTRQAGFAAYFEYKISQDFGAGRSPKYLLVTGEANIPRGRGRSQLARSVVYVTEATTGQMVAYVMPWDSTLQAAGKPQQGTFLKLGTVQLRADNLVRDQ
jgi:hypothetical protein